MNTVELFMFYEHLKAQGLTDKLETNYMYVNVIDVNNTYISYYKDQKVHSFCDRTGMSLGQTLEYLYESLFFFQGLREILYWNSINDYKKYVPCTGEIRTIEGIEAVTEDECVFAKNKDEAMSLFKKVGISDILYVIDIDE